MEKRKLFGVTGAWKDKGRDLLCEAPCVIVDFGYYGTYGIEIANNIR
jgi:hypothetical protein